MDFDVSLDARWARLQDLGPLDVHDLLKLRQDVFVVEQESLYRDIDGQDPEALHLLVRLKPADKLVGILRLVTDPEAGRARIGRVVIAPEGRGSGLGRKLMWAGITKAEELVADCTIDLAAQAHLERFYQSFGFATVSEEYLEDGIPHLDMIRRNGRRG